MLSFNYTIKNLYTGKEFTIGEDLDGDSACETGLGILLQEYPLFQLDVRNEEQVKASQHGIWDFFSFYGKRNITLSGIIKANNHKDLVVYQRLIREVLALPAQPILNVNDGYVQVSWLDDDNVEWFVMAKIQQDPTFVRALRIQNRSSFFLNMKSKDSYILSLIQNEQAQKHGWVGNQMSLPSFLPNNFNVVYNNLINIYQLGTADAPGIFKIDGPLVNPVISKFQEEFSNEIIISDFGSEWVGGSDDLSNFQTGSIAQKLTSINGVQDVMTLEGSWDLSTSEYITGFFYVDSVANMAYGSYDYTLGQNYIRFIQNEGVDEFIAPLEEGCSTIRDGWNYFRALKDEFILIGNPSWTAISKLECSIKGKVGTDLEVTFDDFKARDITHTETFLKLTMDLPYDDSITFDTQEGTILNQDGLDVSANITLSSTWLFANPRQSLFLLQSDNNPAITNEFPYTYNNPMIEDGLVGNWHFDDKASGIATDFVNQNHGVIEGGVNYVDSSIVESYWALNFNGSSGEVLVTDSLAIQDVWDNGGGLSIWIDPDSDGEAGEGYLFSKEDADSGWGLRVSDESGGLLKLEFYCKFSGADGLWETTNFEVPVGEQSHVVVVYDSSADTNNPKMYINSNEVPLTETVSPGGTRVSDVSTNLYFGNREAGDRTWDGNLDKIRLYGDSSVLTQSKINDLYYNPGMGEIKNQLTVYWRESML